VRQSGFQNDGQQDLRKLRKLSTLVVQSYPKMQQRFRFRSPAWYGREQQMIGRFRRENVMRPTAIVSLGSVSTLLR
jgi:hypothetical protein